MSTRPNVRSAAAAIAATCERVAPGGFDELHGVAAVGEVGDGNMHAVFGKTLGECLADAVGAAGDDRDLVLVPFAHESVSLKCCCLAGAQVYHLFPEKEAARFSLARLTRRPLPPGEAGFYVL